MGWKSIRNPSRCPSGSQVRPRLHRRTSTEFIPLGCSHGLWGGALGCVILSRTPSLKSSRLEEQSATEEVCGPVEHSTLCGINSPLQLHRSGLGVSTIILLPIPPAQRIHLPPERNRAACGSLLSLEGTGNVADNRARRLSSRLRTF